MSEIVLLAGARSAFTEFCGSFKDTSAIDLGAAVVKEAIARSAIQAEEVDEVIMGNVIHSSPDAVFLARHVGLKAGVPVHKPALTVNRLCGSGLQAIINGAQSLLLGEGKLIVAGGTENMSQVPHVIRGARWGLPLGQAPMTDYLWDALYDSYGDCTMAMTAENLAEKYAISREDVDQFAWLSHQRALQAQEKGYFKQEIVPIAIRERKGEKWIDQDEHPRDTPVEVLAKLSPRFKQNGVVTAGNASGINDGAAAVVLATSAYAEKQNLQPLARLVSWGIVGVEPKYMGIGPVPAIKEALRRANLKVDDLDLVEINEAFAAQYLACQQELNFNPEIGNVNGGAVALGHPLGASGARISLSLIHELHRRGGKYGAAALCIGGGQGIAAIWERL